MTIQTAQRARDAIADLLTALGRDTSDPRIARTPDRVAQTLLELLTRTEPPAPTLMPSDGYRDPISIGPIPFHSLCEHHLLPFRGHVTIAYLPSESIVGVSTFARVIDYMSRDLQMQERLTVQIADWIDLEVRPRGVGVVVDAEHMCMSMRDVGTPQTRVTSRAFRGDMHSMPEQADS